MKKILKLLRDARIYFLISLAGMIFLFLLPWILKGLDIVRNWFWDYGTWVKGL